MFPVIRFLLCHSIHSFRNFSAAGKHLSVKRRKLFSGFFTCVYLADVLFKLFSINFCILDCDYLVVNVLLSISGANAFHMPPFAHFLQTTLVVALIMSYVNFFSLVVFASLVDWYLHSVVAVIPWQYL